MSLVATRDNGSAQQITDGVCGLFVPHAAPAAVAVALTRLIADPRLGWWLGGNLRRRVERQYSAGVAARRWEALFDELLSELP